MELPPAVRKQPSPGNPVPPPADRAYQLFAFIGLLLIGVLLIAAVLYFSLRPSLSRA